MSGESHYSKKILTLNSSAFCSLNWALHALVSLKEWDSMRREIRLANKTQFVFHSWTCSLMHYRHQSINVCLWQILLSEASGFRITLEDNDFDYKGFTIDMIGNKEHVAFYRRIGSIFQSILTSISYHTSTSIS